MIRSAGILEVESFPIGEALELVKWKNFRERIELCLNEAGQPFFVEF